MKRWLLFMFVFVVVTLYACRPELALLPDASAAVPSADAAALSDNAASASLAPHASAFTPHAVDEGLLAPESFVDASAPDAVSDAQAATIIDSGEHVFRGGAVYALPEAHCEQVEPRVLSSLTRYSGVVWCLEYRTAPSDTSRLSRGSESVPMMFTWRPHVRFPPEALHETLTLDEDHAFRAVVVRLTNVYGEPRFNVRLRPYTREQSYAVDEDGAGAARIAGELKVWRYDASMDRLVSVAPRAQLAGCSLDEARLLPPVYDLVERGRCPNDVLGCPRDERHCLNP